MYVKNEILKVLDQETKQMRPEEFGLGLRFYKLNDLEKTEIYNTGMGSVDREILVAVSLIWTQQSLFKKDVNSVLLFKNSQNWAFIAIENVEELSKQMIEESLE
jgi:hypothetical protein